MRTSGSQVASSGNTVMTAMHSTIIKKNGIDESAKVPAAGLPQAHVGVDAGPVIIQDGDYFGSTVNVASRIAAYARAGEVLASDRAVEAAGGPFGGVRTQGLGPVDLRGIADPVPLQRVERAT